MPLGGAFSRRNRNVEKSSKDFLTTLLVPIPSERTRVTSSDQAGAHRTLNIKTWDYAAAQRYFRLRIIETGELHAKGSRPHTPPV